MFKLNRNIILWKNFVYVQRRCKHNKVHWSQVNKKQFPKDVALAHFDDFYKTVFGKRWHSMRIALLCQHKYCAVINNYSDSENIIKELENQGALNLRKLFEIEKNRIQEEAGTARHTTMLDNIYKMDKKMELLMLSKQQNEHEQLYPQQDGLFEGALDAKTKESHSEQPSLEDLKQRSMSSLKSSLDEAEFDQHRVIDPTSGLSAAALFEFIPATKLKGMEDWMSESQHYGYYKEPDFPVKVKEENELNFPENLHIYTFGRGNVSSFPAPRRGKTGVFNYYLLDGSSVLPVLALDLQPGDKVLDMCSAPGGKALLMLQTLYPELVVCNDNQLSRTSRILSVLKQFFYDIKKRDNQIIVTHRDGRNIDEKDVYNKILVDVPCTTDRHVIHENDNNIFKSTRLKERLRLPETQAELLFNALKLVTCGGTVVYATCSLSPIQNDGVVHMALRRVWQETSIEVEVRDLTGALTQTRDVYRIGGKEIGLRYGNLVLPFLPNNFGPLYFCKIVRTK